MKTHHLTKSAPYMATSILGTTILYFLPFLIMLLYALSGGNSAIAELLRNRAFAIGAKNTILYLSLGIGLSLLIGLFLAMRLGVTSLATTVLLLASLMIPSAALAVICRSIFASDGLLNDILSHLHLADYDWLSEPIGLFLMILLLIWKVTGINTAVFLTAHRRIPREIVESAKLDGASGLRLFFRIKWPYLVNSIYFAGLMDLFFAWRSFREIYLLTGDYPNDNLYFIQHYIMHAFHRLQYERLSVASLVLTVTVVVAAGILFFLANRWGKDVEQ